MTYARCQLNIPLKSSEGGGGGVESTPIAKGRDTRRQISTEPLKGTNLGVG